MIISLSPLHSTSTRQVPRQDSGILVVASDARDRPNPRKQPEPMSGGSKTFTQVICPSMGNPSMLNSPMLAAARLTSVSEGEG